MQPGEVKLGRNVHVGKNVRLFGQVSIGNGSIIEDNVTLGHPNKQEFEDFRNAIIQGKKLPMEETVHGSTKIGNECVIRSGTVIYTGTHIGDKLDCGHNVLIQWDVRIGKNCMIMDNSRIYAHAILGDNVRFNGFGCARCRIGSNASMLGYLVHKYKIPKGGLIEKSPRVEDMAVVGMLAVVIGDVTVRKGAYVGAGSVVTHDVEPFSIVVGAPARAIRKRTSESS